MLRQLQLKKHALTAISYMFPVVVTAGLLIDRMSVVFCYSVS